MKAKPKATRKAMRLPDPNRFEKRLTTIPTRNPNTLHALEDDCLQRGAKWIREALKDSGEKYVLGCLKEAGLTIGRVRLQKWLKDHPEA
jgi:hypothetical protein